MLLVYFGDNMYVDMISKSGLPDFCVTGIGRSAKEEFWLYGSKGSLHLDLDKQMLYLALADQGEISSCWQRNAAAAAEAAYLCKTL